MENKILFINSCTRPNSRTKELAKHLLNYLEGEITQVDLYKANIGPIESFELEKRTENIKKSNFSCPEFEQAKQFTKATEVTSLAITKLDGTAKGGVVIGISDQFKIPVKYIGLGEGIEDLQAFRRKEFVDSLFGETEK